MAWVLRNGMERFFLLGLVAALVSLGFACERNELVGFGPDDGDDTTADGDDGDLPDGDADGDGDDDGDTDEEPPPEPLALSKWVMAHNSRVALGVSEQILMIGPAGLVVLNHAGTPDDLSDDSYVIHHDLTLEGWPVADPVAVCADGAGLIWFSSQSALALLSLGSDPGEPGDERLLIPDPERVLPGTREVFALFCETDGPGVWVSTSAGLVRIIPDAEDLFDESAWAVHDFNGQHETLGAYPNAITRDTAGRFWIVVYTESGFALRVVEALTDATLANPTVHTVPFGFESPTPSVLAPDGDVGLWVVHNRQVWHLTHGGTLANAADDVWVALPVPGEAKIGGLLYTESGHALAFEEGSRNIYDVSVAASASPDDDTALALPDFGVDSGNLLVGAIYEPGVGLWYSAQKSAGLLVRGNDGWTPLSLASLGAVPGNDLSGFVADEAGVWLGGPTGVVRVNYEADTHPEEFEFIGHAISLPDSPSPFGVTTLLPLASGLLIGGGYLAWLGSDAQVTLWAERNSPKNINLLAPAPGDTLLVSTVLRTLATIVGFRAYDYRKTPANPKDDRDQNIDNAYFGFASGLPIQTLTALGDCRFLVGTIADLHYWDCGDDPLDPSDDTLHSNLVFPADSNHPDQNIRSVSLAPEGGVWFVSKDGLGYLDFGDPADSDDNVLVRYPIPSISNEFSVDPQGRLVYFMRDGLMIHDPKGTPADPDDDEAIIFPMRSDRRAVVKIDSFGNLWFSMGDGSGIFHGKLGPLEFSPLAELLAN